MTEEKQYCPRCDKEFEGDWEKHDCYVPLVKAMDAIGKRYQEVCVGKTYRLVNVDKALETNVYEKEIWNEAIEAAADRIENFDLGLAEIIRELKK